MLELLALGLAAVAVIVALQTLADRTGLPAAALLTLAGLIYAELPGPNVRLNPDVILTVVIPPLIYSAALNSSLLAIRRNLRVVISLSIGLVLASSLAVGVGFDLFVPGAGLAAGVALGAAVSPADPVAALAVGVRAGLPARLITIIEGEGLLNDATALTTLTVAVTAATSGGFSLGDATARFLLAAAGCGPASTAGCAVTRSPRDPTTTGLRRDARPRWRPAGPSSTRSARNCCAGGTPAACPTRACASWNASWTTRNASSPARAATDPAQNPDWAVLMTGKA